LCPNRSGLKRYKRVHGRILAGAVFTMVLMTDLFAHVPDGFGQGASIPKEFVYLRDIDLSILQDIRYSSANNFTGKPVPGYGAAECILLRPAAEALKRVQVDLASQNLSLKVYDCYRPRRAVQAFVQWANDGKDSEATKRFYPGLKKSELFAARYISSASGHSRGNAVDLSLVQLPPRPQAAFDPNRRYGTCAAPAEERAPDNSVDMGTGFDCFNARSHTATPDISAEQQRWRGILVAAMERHQFKNYAGEWWHFTYQMPGSPVLKAHDFPILPRPAAAPSRD
jgi:D-alanyl-D-alanine dipeptidase